MTDGPMAVPWFVQPNDLIGGWCVMPVPKPPSCGVPEIADFCRREVAEHIAKLHNDWLAAERERVKPPGGEAQRPRAPGGTGTWDEWAAKAETFLGGELRGDDG